MGRFLSLGHSAQGEPTIWGHWSNESAKKKPGAWPLAGRAWLHWPGNSLGVDWAFFTRKFRFSVALSDLNDDAVVIGLALPFLLSLWISLGRCAWVMRLPGVKWHSGEESSGEREISVAVHHGTIWWVLWRNPNSWKSNDWRHDGFNLPDFFLGRSEYFESQRRRHTITIVLPEGEYAATVDLYTAIWIRRRWPWPQRVKRAAVEIVGGIPVPGDGENDWDLDDDAISLMMLPAETAAEAQIEVQLAVLKDRDYDSDWAPAAGWPVHCKRF